MIGAAELIGRKSFDARQMFHVYPLDPIPNTRWDFVAFVDWHAWVLDPAEIARQHAAEVTCLESLIMNG